MYNITSLLSLLEDQYKDPAIGSKLAYTICIGGNDLSKPHDTVCKTVLESSHFRISTYTVDEERFSLNKDVFIDLVKYMYFLKRKQCLYIPFEEEVRAISIAKTEYAGKTSGYKHASKIKWLPSKSAIARLANLFQLQIDYLQTAGTHEYKLPNFLGTNCLRVNKSGEIEYDFGEESHFQSINLPSVETSAMKKNRTWEHTPQGGDRKKRQLTSTPRAK